MTYRTAAILAFILNVVLYSFVLGVGIAVWKCTEGVILAVLASAIVYIILKVLVVISSR